MMLKFMFKSSDIGEIMVSYCLRFILETVLTQIKLSNFTLNFA